ncbi:aminoglycoside adenylyltransferase family protein [Streptomyces sp. NPDC058548]|uniref:aminoglycoside adenylyltransferase family protein n=1 Tax=unclassified Streptomyces TaxID=2593676 RepID=UPI00365F07C1
MTHAEGREQAEHVVRLVRDVLGSEVLAACLHGSAVLGGLRPGSDVDVLVTVRRRTTGAERRSLVEALLAVSGERAYEGPARPVELSVVVHSEVRPWRYPPVCEFLYGEWLRDGFEAGETPVPAPCPDLAPLITMARAGNAPLLGPPPAEVFDPVPEDDLRAAIVAGVPELLEDLDGDTRNVLLTLARVLSTLATGEIRSKDAAADWVLERLPAIHRPALAEARALYVAGEYGSWTERRPEVLALARYMTASVREVYPL